MEVRKGYKQTEVGVIPEDWDSSKIGEHAFVTKLAGFEYTLYFDYSKSGPIIAIRGLNIKNGRLDLSDIHTIPKETSDSLTRSKLKKGDLVITYVGTLGRVAVIPEDDKYHLAPNVAKITVNKKTVSPNYLTHYLNSSQGQKSIIEAAASTTQAALSMRNLRELFFVHPTLAEQEAIAEALSDADALIESLETLLAKKRQVKQGAMSELLKPKKSWTSTNLGSIADPNKRWSFTGGPFGSNLKSSDYTEDGIRIIQLQNIGDGEFKDNYEVYTSIQKADELISCNIYPGEIILSKMGDPVARACIIPDRHSRYLMCSDGIRLAVDTKKFDTYFIYTIINARDFRTKAENAGTGSTRKRIGLTELRNLELFCPPLPEQTAIAEILSDMDAEIRAVEEKLVKYPFHIPMISRQNQVF